MKPLISLFPEKIVNAWFSRYLRFHKLWWTRQEYMLIVKLGSYPKMMNYWIMCAYLCVYMLFNFEIFIIELFSLLVKRWYCVLFLVGNVAAQRRRQNAVTVGKERSELLVRAKRLCRVGTSGYSEVSVNNDMMIDEEQSILETQTAAAVEDLKSAVAYQYVNHAFPCIK